MSSYQNVTKYRRYTCFPTDAEAYLFQSLRKSIYIKIEESNDKRQIQNLRCCSVDLPRVEIAKFVVFSALIVKSMNKLVTHNHADTTEVESFGIIGVVKWNLKKKEGMKE